MVKPRVSRKQPIVVSSDSEEDAPDTPPSKRPRKGSRSQNVANEGLAASKPHSRVTSSPKATKKSPAKSPGKSKAIHKPITSFFGTISQLKPRTQPVEPSPSPEKSAASNPLIEEDDIIDSSEDERPLKSRSSKAPPSGLLAVRGKGISDSASALRGLPKGSQRFRLTTDGSQNTPPPSQALPVDSVETKPWNERFCPVTLDELAVHKKKVSDVRTWLSNVFNGKERKRLLLLKGPAGSGKTTTMLLLAKELGIHMHEWKNPTTATTSSEGSVSVTAQFEDFVGRTGAFGSLSFDEPVSNHSIQPTPSPQSRQKQLVLVEEFPNTFARASTTVQSFRSSVLNYLSAATPSATAFFSTKVDPDQPITPIVMIVSETLLSTNTAAADSFTAHRLLGPEILTHAGVSIIEFNPIAPTFMAKALELIVLKEARKSGRRKTAGPQVIQRLSELGDIRSAASSLEFLCLRGDDDEGWGGKVTFTKKKGSKDVPLTKMEKESLEMVTQRESTLGIFHAVGRVVHNKRAVEDAGKPIPQPPNWFPERRRPKVSEVNMDTLIDELGTDTQTFIAALHENFVLSCEGADSEETMDSIEGCLDTLSDADLLSPDRFGNTGSGRRTFQGTGADTLRQDEMSFQVSVRGLLYHLPHPVKRVAPPPGVMGVKKGGPSKGSANSMYYPTSLRIWRQQEEIGGQIELWISRAQRGEMFTATTGLATPVIAQAGGVETWRRSNPFSTSTPPSAPPATQTPSTPPAPLDDPPPTILLGSGGSARYEMLLERLPYLPIILRKSKSRSAIPSPATASTIREIQKITSFTGSSLPAATDEDDDENENEDVGGQEGEAWATDRQGPETPRKKRRVDRMGIQRKGEEAEGELGAPGGMGKEGGLVLSDDDIED